MRYPVLIEAGDERTAWGVVVPDLPGVLLGGRHA
ncbi:type II toxin-antitoxin system HicB family antitoxin [Stenotrophomonas maltophilia]|nr:type II toxin-antitoxin system HicB family antitoxin [Stenotrophomonas maltophilia]UXB26725.1 type II toxin-antitoxin system HicB family antitoxin [Stenotrophomonas maltophilia]